MANSRILHLRHFWATRTIPIKKKDGIGRPVGIGNIIRRICLKVIDQHHRQKLISVCQFQLGDGISAGSEAIVHSIRKVSEDLYSNKRVILELDTSIAFNLIHRDTALNEIYKRVPELYFASLNTYGLPSYTLFMKLSYL